MACSKTSHFPKEKRQVYKQNSAKILWSIESFNSSFVCACTLCMAHRFGCECGERVISKEKDDVIMAQKKKEEQPAVEPVMREREKRKKAADYRPKCLQVTIRRAKITRTKKKGKTINHLGISVSKDTTTNKCVLAIVISTSPNSSNCHYAPPPFFSNSPFSSVSNISLFSFLCVLVVFHVEVFFSTRKIKQIAC